MLLLLVKIALFRYSFPKKQIGHNLVLLTRQLLHDLSLLAPLWNLTSTTTIPFLAFADYYTSSTFAYSCLLKEKELAQFSTISCDIWKSFCQAICLKLRGGGDAEEWLGKVCAFVVWSVEKVFGEDSNGYCSFFYLVHSFIWTHFFFFNLIFFFFCHIFF